MSSYDPIRPYQHVWRYRHADLLGGFQVNDQFKLHGLLDGEVGGFCAFEDFVHNRPCGDADRECPIYSTSGLHLDK